MSAATPSVIRATRTEIAAVAEARRIARLHGESLRKTAQLTLGEVGRHVGVSAQTVWNWERGSAQPTGAPAARYLDLLRELERIA